MGGAGWRASIANWRSGVEGSKIDESVQSAVEGCCTSCGKAAFPFSEEGLYLRADDSCEEGGGWGHTLCALMWGTSAIIRRIISVAKSGAAVIDFKSSLGLGRFVDR